MALEEEYNIEISDEEAEKILTVATQLSISKPMSPSRILAQSRLKEV